MIRIISLLCFLAAWGWTVNLRAAEIGDINGDGRVSFADARQLGDWLHSKSPAMEPSPGSDDFAGVLDCSNSTLRPDREPGDGFWLSRNVPDLIYLESLRRLGRRLGETPMPHFFEEWPAPDAEEDSPPADARVVVEVLPTFHRTRADEAFLEVLIETTQTIRGFSLVLAAEGLDLRPVHRNDSDNPIESSTDFYVISRGLLAYRSRFLDSEILPAGLTTLALPLRVPNGAEPGAYEVRAVDAEAVLATEEVIRPETRNGVLEITQRITSGIDQPFPPIEFDEAERRIVGAGEFHITDAEGFPGDRLTARLQVRTPRAANLVKSVMIFDADALQVEEVVPLYADSGDGVVHPEHYLILITQHRAPPFEGQGQLSLLYQTAGKHQILNTTRPYARGLSTAGLEYLSPLNEWIDLYEIRFRIRPEAVGLGETAFEFMHDGDVDLQTWGTGLRYEPYMFPNWSACRDLAPFWTHEEPITTGGTVTILGGGEPPPPPEPPVDPEVAEIRFEIGGTRASPGETVALPISFESAEELWMLRIALGYDSTQLEFVAFESEGVDADGNPETVLLTADNGGHLSKICEGEGWERMCRGGLPLFTLLRGLGALDTVPDDVLLIDMNSTLLTFGGQGQGNWEPSRHYDLGLLHFRVRETATSPRLEIAGVEVEWMESHVVKPRNSVTSGFPVLGGDPPERGAAVPALEVEAGVILVDREGQEPVFVRGDSNSDGDFNLADPTRTLGTLFGGLARLPCDDAADANDDGALNVADAVYSLNHLFSGGAAPPPPFPEPGIDPTEDALDCEEPLR